MSEELLEHTYEMMAGLGRLRSLRMFGARGLYCDELFIAIIAGDELFLKTNANTQAAFVEQGSTPFTYQREGRAATLGFHRAPLDALDSPESMRPWARLAIQAALEAKNGKKPKASAPAAKAAPKTQAAGKQAPAKKKAAGAISVEKPAKKSAAKISAAKKKP